MGRLIMTASGGVLEVGDAPIRGPLGRGEDFWIGPSGKPPSDDEIAARAKRLVREMEEAMSERVCRAKFICNGVTKKVVDSRTTPPTLGYEADFSAVYAGSEENDQYFRATPYGSLKMATLKADFFEPGKTYYLDFVAAD